MAEKEKAFTKQIHHWEEKGWEELKWIITDREEETAHLLEKGLNPILLSPKKEKDEEISKETTHQVLKVSDWLTI